MPVCGEGGSARGLGSLIILTLHDCGDRRPPPRLQVAFITKNEEWRCLGRNSYLLDGRAEGARKPSPGRFTLYRVFTMDLAPA